VIRPDDGRRFGPNLPFDVPDAPPSCFVGGGDRLSASLNEAVGDCICNLGNSPAQQRTQHTANRQAHVASVVSLSMNRLAVAVQ
jgi:hypothetical protein